MTRRDATAWLGRIILAQPDQFAWQVFDKEVLHLLRDDYRIKRVSKVSGDTIEELASKPEGVNAAGFLDEVRTFNASIKRDPSRAVRQLPDWVRDAPVLASTRGLAARA
jgi:hypothetical protein